MAPTPPRAMRFIVFLLGTYILPPSVAIELLDSALQPPPNELDDRNLSLSLNHTNVRPPVTPDSKITSPVLPSGPHCMLRGHCATDFHGTKQNCEYTGPPVELQNSTAIKIYKDLCPDMFDEFGLKVCCDTTQLVALEENVATLNMFFGRCPSCLRNFHTLWCQSTCHPHQSDFINIVSTEPITGAVEPTVPGANRFVTGIQYYVHENFTSGFWDSCKSVQFPSTQAPVVNSIFCTASDSCSIKDMLKFLGNKQDLPDKVPMQITFEIADEADGVEPRAVFNPLSFSIPSAETTSAEGGGKKLFKPVNPRTIPCSQAISPDGSACSCQDCEATCGEVVPFPNMSSSNCLILGGKMDCWVFVSLVAFVALCLVILLMAAVHCFWSSYRSRVSDSPVKYPLNPLTAAIENSLHLTMEEDVTFWESLGAWVEAKVEDLFQRWGVICARHPFKVFFFGLFVSLLCSGGFFFVQFTTDPVKLWSAPGSRARNEKEFFDNHFSPFYRTEQVIILPTDKSQINSVVWTREKDKWGPVFRKEFMMEAFELQNAITNLTVKYKGREVGLSDICFKPMAPDMQSCAFYSIWQYFQNDKAKFDKKKMMYSWVKEDYTSHLTKCFDQPTSLDCIAEFGAPVPPYLVLGGFEEKNYSRSTAFVMTFLANNHANSELNEMAEAWEKEYIQLLKDFRSDNMKIHFVGERSIQDEIERESNSDVTTILISYTVMFFYIAFALGQYKVSNNNLLYMLVESKIVLGLAGVGIVLLSVTASVGVYAYCGIPATLIIVEVVPFLVLAVGVDNIFILVQAYQRDKKLKNERLEDRIGRICGEVVPSMLLSSLSECFCFFLGALSSMPAVKIFSLYAAMAIFFDFFLQVTCFLALFTLDIRRQESGRLEVCCCARLEPSDSTESDDLLHSFIRDYYAPALMKKPVRLTVFIFFLAWLFSSVAVFNKIETGLDQKLSMPEDSYVLRYFETMEEYLSVGPPLYFVIEGKLEYSQPKIQNYIFGGSGSHQNSLPGQISSAAHFKNQSYVAHPVSNWLDDYFDWLRPVSGDSSCCRLYEDDQGFCPSSEHNASCKPCNVTYSHGRPPSQQFYLYIDDFLMDNPNINCPKGGHAAYGNALAFEAGKTDVITASYFMTYHTILKTSDDYIHALKGARWLADNITKTINDQLEPGAEPINVFPYSIFYVFYEQYLTVVHDAVIQLVLSMAAIFLVTTLFLGIDPWSAAMITITIFMILLNLCGLMYWWNINFNALSLVNLVMAVGMSVEFCAHIVRANALSVLPTRVERAREALGNMGGSVLSGITLTKFGGIIVLGFSHSQIFQVFYFRMYLGIVFFGAAHGLIFLPVLLSFLGPSVNKQRVLKYQRTEFDTSPRRANFASSRELLEAQAILEVDECGNGATLVSMSEEA